MAVIKKNLKNYTPGRNDFLHFANVMNKNAALDLGGTQGLQDSKLLPVQNPIDTNNAGNALTPKPNNIAAPVIEKPALIEPINKDESETATDNGLNSDNANSKTEETITSPNDVSEDKYKTDNKMLGESDWYSSQGLDPERDYQNTVNMLNYEYQTSMATYGQNAENLYQMGLQNSGVSDIFQSNAFSTYLANMNAAAAAKIAAQKQNKALYNVYTEDWKNQRNNVVSSAAEWVSSEMSRGNTDVEKLKNQAKQIYNLSDEEISRISDIIDISSEKASGEILNRLKAFFTDVYGDYSGSEEEKTAAKNYFKNIFSEDAITRAFESLDEEQSAINSAVLKDFVNLEVGNRVLDDKTIEDLKALTEDGTYDMTAINDAITQDLDYVLNNEEGFKNGFKFAGLPEESWNTLSDEAKVNTILNKASQLKKEGLITQETWSNVVADHIATTFETARENKKEDEWFDEKNDNRYSFVILNTAADTAIFYKEQYENGTITEEDYKAVCVEINNQLDEDERKGLYKNMEVYTKDASGFDRWAESIAQWGPEAVEDVLKTIVDVMPGLGAKAGAEIGRFIASKIAQIDHPLAKEYAKVYEYFKDSPSSLVDIYDLIVDNPQEAKFFDVYNKLDTDGKHALADIYMAAAPEDRVEKEWWRGGLRGLAVSNAINQSENKKEESGN